MEYPLRHELVFSLVVGADLKNRKRSASSPQYFALKDGLRTFNFPPEETIYTVTSKGFALHIILSSACFSPR